MKRISLLLVGLLCVSVMVHAGEVITNDTGEEAAGLRVVFSRPVLITAFGDILTSVDSQTLSFEFTFSGGTVTPWESHWFNYAPATAHVMETEWLTGSTASGAPQGSLSRDDLMNLGRAPTYEEIMSVIAEYPGPDEPLYVPAEDEAIWLTDLEGHADIYDNASIQINYADWYDRSQVSRIEIRRNGIKMRFLPDKFDVLTNEQMKTFDGNPLEHTPASDHTDHAIFGYEYALSFQGGDPALQIKTATIVSPFRYSGEASLNIGDMLSYVTLPFSQLVSTFRGYEAEGFDMIQFSVTYFMETSHSNFIFAQEFVDPSISYHFYTMSNSNIRKLISAIHEAGLEVDARIEIWLSDEYKEDHPSETRGAISPSNVRSWFNDYANKATDLARILQEEGVEKFTPFTEMQSMEAYDTYVRDTLDKIRAVYSGRLAIETAVHGVLADNVLRTATGGFWDYENLEICFSGWICEPYETQKDQRASSFLSSWVTNWKEAFDYFRSNFPGHKVGFGEFGNYEGDGAAMNLRPPTALDLQEGADIWGGLIEAAIYLDADFISVWQIHPVSVPYGDFDLGDIVINSTPAERVVYELIE